LFQKFLGAKRSKQRRSKTFQEQRGANRGVPKLFRSKGEQTKTLKLLRNEEEQTNGIPKLFRSKEEQREVFQSY